MERRQGYLVIDDFSREQADYYEHYWVCIEGVEYYFKPTEFVYNELIGYRIAQLLGIDACYCDLAILNGQRGIISKSLRSPNSKLVPGNLIVGEYAQKFPDIIKNMGFVGGNLEMIIKNCLDGNSSLVYSINNLEVIIRALEWRYGHLVDINKIIEQFILMYLYTIIVTDVDRGPLNWMILEMPNNIGLGPLIDNEWTFRDTDAETPISLFVDFKDYYSTPFESLQYFLSVYPKKYFTLFEEMFDKVIVNFEGIIKAVEKQTGVPIPSEIKTKIVRKFTENVK